MKLKRTVQMSNVRLPGIAKDKKDVKLGEVVDLDDKKDAEMIGHLLDRGFEKVAESKTPKMKTTAPKAEEKHG